jgi:outer membrane protein assembly factor BamD
MVGTTLNVDGASRRAGSGPAGRRAVLPRLGAVRVAALGLVLVSASSCSGLGAGRPRTTLPTNQALYEKALEDLNHGRYEKARQALVEIGTREVQSPELDPLVKLATADSYFYQPGIANLIEAQSRYQQFISYHPSSSLVGYAQFQVAMCLYKQAPEPYHDQTNTLKALEEFGKVRILNPNGRYLRAADLMRDRCLEKLARHDYQVGVFYFKRKAYQGAIARMKGVLDSFPRFSTSDGVYYHLGIALMRAGSEAEGKLYLEKVQRDFPESKFARMAREEIGALGG